MENNQNGNSSEQESYHFQLKYLSSALRTIAQEMQIRSEILTNPAPFEPEASIMTG